MTNIDYHFLIEQAVKAPSGHNTQPWIFRISENSIEIRPDYTKTLKIVDGNCREMYVSLGCAAENLCIAAEAKGYACSLKETENDKLWFQLTPQSTPQQLSSESLAGQIAKRQVNRSVYSGKMIEDPLLEKLTSIRKEKNIQLHCWKNGTPEFNRILRYILEGNEIQMKDPFFIHELKAWMRFNKKHEQKTRDGLSYAVFGAPNLPLWISRPIMNACLKPGIQNKNDRKKILSSSHLALFTVKNDTPPEWIALGRTLERFLLATTQAGIATAFVNQPCEIKVITEQMQKEVLDLSEKEIPVVLLRLGYAPPLPYSPRKEITQVIISD